MNESVKLPFATSHAFVIGINDYQHLSPLKTAVNDAKGIAKRLELEHGYRIHGPLLNPGKTELERYLTETLANSVGPEDRIVVYFAGHGIALDGEDGPNGYIVPANAVQGDRSSLVSMETLHKSLQALPCKHGLLILDCCFSGAFKWSTGFRDVVFDLPKVIYEERFWRYTKDPAWQVITSSAYDQKAVDVISNQSLGMREEGEGIHSPFAEALFQAIEGEADVVPAEQGDGVITASELYAYLRDHVESNTQSASKRQSPSMFNLGRHDKGEFIFLNPRHRFNLPPTPDRNPFMGLASYNEADSNFFFGRDRVTEALLEKVQNNSLTVVSGASGTGKSSVIKAGLLPKLRKEGWELLTVIRPGKEPLQVLGGEIGDISQKLPEDRKTLLIIDQYEELITQCLYEKDRELFEQELAKWLTTYPNLAIILSIRSDFEPQFESQALAPWWKTGRYVVPTFSMEEIEEIITKPAMQAVLFYEPIELVEKLKEDVSQAPGALPLLSFTLSELYYAYLNSGRQDRGLTLEDYEKMGGVIGSLRSKADQVYANLDHRHQDSMKKLMLRMVALEGGDLASRRIYGDELSFSQKDENRRIQHVAEKLSEARLIVKGKDNQGRIYLEPSHDALVRAWARLWEWIKEVGEEKLVWQNKLSLAVKDYHEQKLIDPAKAENLLWNRNPRLDILKEELNHGFHSFNAQEEAFVKGSVALRIKKQRQFIRNIVLVAAALLGISIAAGILFYQNKENIELADQREKDAQKQGERADTAEKGLAEQLKEAQSAYLSAQALKELESHSTLAIHSAMEAYKRTPTPSFDNKQAILTAFENARQFPFYTRKFKGPAKFSTDGHYIISAPSEGGLKLWDTDGNFLHNFTELRAKIRLFCSAPSGKVLGLSEDGELYLWNMDGKLLLKWSSNPQQVAQTEIQQLAISSDSKYLLSTDYKQISIWDQTGKKLYTFPTGWSGNSLYTYRFEFVPNQSLILASQKDAQPGYGPAYFPIRMWDLEGNMRLEKSVAEVKFPQNPLEEKLYTMRIKEEEVSRSAVPARRQGYQTVWHHLGYNGEKLKEETGPYITRKIMASYPIHNLAVSFSLENLPGHQTDDIIMFSGLKTGPISIEEDNFTFSLSAFSQDGKKLLVGNNGSGIGKIVIWDTRTGKRVQTLTGAPGSQIVHASFSKDGQKILSQNEHHESYLWDLSIDGVNKQVLKTEENVRNIIIAENNDSFLSLNPGKVVLRDLSGKTLYQKELKKKNYSMLANMSKDGENIFYTNSDSSLTILNRTKDRSSEIKFHTRIVNVHFLEKLGQIQLFSEDSLYYYDLGASFIKKINQDKKRIIPYQKDERSQFSLWKNQSSVWLKEAYEGGNTTYTLQAAFLTNERELSVAYDFSHSSFESYENILAQYFPDKKTFYVGVANIAHYNQTPLGYYLNIFELDGTHIYEPDSAKRTIKEFGDGVSEIFINKDASILASITDQIVMIENKFGLLEREVEASTITLWNLEKGRNHLKKVFTYSGHQAHVLDLAFSQDGSFIMSTDTNKEIHIWYTPKGAYNALKISTLSLMSKEDVGELIGYEL